ncbi:MAG: type III secretion system export apparatus subunit SctT [Burkholderiales bacterium]|jgi:type III secretion protein T
MYAFQSPADLALLLGLSVTRLAVAFLMLPMFTQESLPPVVRNSLFVALGVMTLTVQPQGVALAVDAVSWMALFAKEAFIGLAIGLFASTVLWAVEAAGMLIDAKAGTQLGQIIDPINGQQTSQTGQFLARLATYVFMASGGFMLLVGALVESFAVWPVTAQLPALRPGTLGVFEAEFGRLMLLATMIAAPVIVILFVLENALGVMNRYVPNLNLLALALPLKAMAAVLLVAVLMGTTVDLMVREFTTGYLGLLPMVERLFGR